MTKPTVRIWREVPLEVEQPDNPMMDEGRQKTMYLRINSERGSGIVEFCKPAYSNEIGPAIPFFWVDLDVLEAALAALKA